MIEKIKYIKLTLFYSNHLKKKHTEIIKTINEYNNTINTSPKK